MQKDISLDVEIRKGQKFLILEYKVYNMSKSAIYLMNHLFRLKKTGGWDIPDHNLTYVYPEEKGVIRLAKWAPPIPKDLLTEEICPYVTVVPPGETFREELNLEIPLKPFVAYRNRPYDVPDKKIIAYDHVYFTLGFYPHTEDIKIIHKNIGGVDTISIGGIPAYGESQQLLETEKIELPVEIIMPRKIPQRWW
ncbi:MAG: hypothetical protein ABH870_02930 [bacterium]